MFMHTYTRVFMYMHPCISRSACGSVSLHITHRMCFSYPSFSCLFANISLLQNISTIINHYKGLLTLVSTSRGIKPGCRASCKFVLLDSGISYPFLRGPSQWGTCSCC